MFDICEWCDVLGGGERVKALPFGNRDSKTLVVLEMGFQYDQGDLTSAYPDAYFVYRRACVNVNSDDGNFGCGILIRNILRNYDNIVLPFRMTKGLFGVEVESLVIEFKTGQYLFPFQKFPTEVGTMREYERIIKK